MHQNIIYRQYFDASRFKGFFSRMAISKQKMCDANNIVYNPCTSTFHTYTSITQYLAYVGDGAWPILELDC